MRPLTPTLANIHIDLNVSLMDRIYPAIRLIAFRYLKEERTFTIRFYLDRPPREEDYLEAGYAHEYTTDYYPYVTPKKECIYTTEPLDKLDPLHGVVYARRAYPEGATNPLQSYDYTPFPKMIDNKNSIMAISIALQFALLSEIYPAIHTIVYSSGEDPKFLYSFYYLDRTPTDYDYASIKRVAKKAEENLAYFGTKKIFTECLYIPLDKISPIPTSIVYAKYKPCTDKDLIRYHKILEVRAKNDLS